MAEFHNGKIKWYSISKVQNSICLMFYQRYGFITRDSGEGDVFFHRSAVVLPDPLRIPKLDPDYEVQFTIKTTEKGVEAEQVKGVSGDLPMAEVTEIHKVGGGYRGRGRGRGRGFRGRGRGGRGRGRGRGRGGKPGEKDETTEEATSTPAN